MLNERKKIRRFMLNQRALLSSTQQQHASRLIAQQFRKTLLFLRSNRIAFYFAAKGEVLTLPLLESALAYGKACYFPILHPIKHNHIWFGRYQWGDSLKINQYGILEPDLIYCETSPPWSIDIVITPLVAFDDHGNRLGMGGGYYDRTFSFCTQRNIKPTLIGFAYDFQRVNRLPTEKWDIPLNGVITEKDSYYFHRAP